MDRPDLSPEQTEQIEEIARRMLLEELSLSVSKAGDGILLKLNLRENVIGEFHIVPELKWNRDRGHGGGSYADDVELKIY